VAGLAATSGDEEGRKRRLGGDKGLGAGQAKGPNNTVD